MQGQKSQSIRPHGGGWFKWELKILGLFLTLISLSNLVFNNNTFALYTPTLSAAVDKSDITVSGNDILRFDKTSFNLLKLMVSTNNRTGYTASISSETNETSLKNLESTSGAKIESITEDLPLSDFSANTWGYKMGAENKFKPIPLASSPANIIQTTNSTGYNEYTNGAGYNEINIINLGMKLGDTLESGNYTNKIIISVVANPHEKKARINRGYDFNTSVAALDKNQTIVDGKGKRDNIYHIKRSSVAKNLIPADAVNIENSNTSDYEVKIWFVPSENTVYYWTDAEKITLSRDSSFMFDRMSKLQTIDLSGFDTSEIENMSRMFAASPELKALDFSGFNTSKVKNMTYMFYEAKHIESLDLSMFDTSNVTTMYGIFNEMNALKNLNISSFNTQNVTEMQEMFRHTLALTSLNLSHFNTSKVTSMKEMFSYASNLNSLDLSSFDTSNVTNMYSMFSGMHSIIDLNLSNFNTSKVTNMANMFYGLGNLTSLNISSFDTSSVTSMSSMFFGIANLTTLNLSNFDTRKVEDMANMFNTATKLKTLDLSSFDTRSVKTMYGMFYNMYDLETLLIPNFNTANVTSMNRMFYGVSKIKSLDLSHFDTSKVTDMDSMFAYMPSLTSVKLSSFNTENVEDMSDLFRDSNNLVTIDLSSFNTRKVKDMSYMFSVNNSPQRLKTIYVSDNFTTDSVTNWAYAFMGQVTLRGGSGSYLNNPSDADKSWLRIDDPTHGRPGYFTRKP